MAGSVGNTASDTGGASVFTSEIIPRRYGACIYGGVGTMQIKQLFGTIQRAGAQPESSTSGTRIGVGEAMDRIRTTGIADVARRGLRRVVSRVESKYGLDGLEFPLNERDIASSSSVGAIIPFEGAGPQHVAWLCTPPGAGSGGHTTFFRMVQAVYDAGHSCTVLLYNRHGGSMQRHVNVIRSSWPWLEAEIAEVPEQITGYTSCVASSWETAHVLASRRIPSEAMNPYYLIQDFEPYFYPRGSMYALSEDTYRFGFTNLALGAMVGRTIERETGAQSIQIPFGSDTANYRRQSTGQRSGVVFFVRPGIDRRGFEMGRLALAEFHRRYPEQMIHTYGSRYKNWGFPVVQHGVLTPAQLNSLYNTVVAGLALSFTNITLVAAEMLASGAIAVVNEDREARTILRNGEAVWCPASPVSLADGLASVIEDPDVVQRSQRAADFKETSWSEAQEALVKAVIGNVERN